MALCIESGKIIGQLLTVLKYAAKVRNDTCRFRPSPRKIKVLLMKSSEVLANQPMSLFKYIRGPVKALPVPVMPKVMITKKKEEFEIPTVDNPDIYGEHVPIEELFDFWIYYAQDKSNLPHKSTETRSTVKGIARPIYPEVKLSRLEQIKQRIRDKLKKDSSNPSKL